MPTYTQAEQPIKITTPLGEDVLLLTRIQGREAISQLFSFQLELVAVVGSDVKFDAILGQDVTVELRLFNDEIRYFNGIIKRFSQGGRDESFIRYRAEMVPKFWLLTKKVRSRIFQHLTVPDILQKLFTGIDVSYEVSGTYFPRDYCVQYRESDFDFASRLMEEEGIYYFFKHENGSHQMVVTDLALQHPEVPGQSDVIYDELEGGKREDMRVMAWEKIQELRSGKYTLWDHCFELPGNTLEAKQTTVASVVVGEVMHKLSVGGNDDLEIYDYPGGYAQRFDGVDRNGVAQAQDLQSIFQDNARTARVRMEQEEAATIEIEGGSNCGQFVAGYKFTLERHFDADGEYLLTRVDHDASLGGYRSDHEKEFTYANAFRCIPVALPFRPQRVTRRPLISGVQTATVVGPSGQDLFCDKYGRIKVQFHWDREGQNNGDSSCWLRVSQIWAGKQWGAMFWPRIGHEVVVAFEEGDPDQPLITGSVYNAENMPPYPLPDRNSLGGIKSASLQGQPSKNFNGIIIDDKKGHEHLALHSERHISFNSELDKHFRGGRNKHEVVSNVSTYVVGSLPGGGSGGGNGSGNGGSGSGSSGPGGSSGSSGSGGSQYSPLGVVPVSGVPGINAIFVYGENLQVATGLNHQIAVGSNVQLCVNPAALAEAFDLPFPEGIKAALGGGVGGNMQLTLGTNANVVLGKSFTLNIGETLNPRTETLAVKIMCAILAALLIVWVILYALPTTGGTAEGRILLISIFDTAAQITIMILMMIAMKYSQASNTWHGTLRNMFQPKWSGWGTTTGTKVAQVMAKIGEGVAEAGFILGVAAIPPITAAATDEFQNDQAGS